MHRLLVAGFFVAANITTAPPSLTALQSTADARPVRLVQVRPLIGLVEIPDLFGPSDPLGPPGQTPPTARIAIPIYPEPNGDTPFFTVSDDNVVEATAHGYEEVSAMVYAERDGWYEVGLFGRPQKTGWLAPRHAGMFRSIDVLLADRLAYVSAAWDQQLWTVPSRDSKPTRVPGSPIQLHPDINQYPQGAGMMPGPEPDNDIAILELRRVNNELWLNIAFEQGRCEGGPTRRTITGWIPAYSATGHLNVWFSSRGC